MASGDNILPSGNLTIQVKGNLILSGNNVVGSSSVTVNLQSTDNAVTINATSSVYGSVTSKGDLSISGSTVTGSVSSTDNKATLTNSTIGGSVTSKGDVTLTGGSVGGSVSTPDNKVITDGTVIGGSVTAKGDVSLKGGSVGGNVTTSDNKVTTNGTSIDGNVTAKGDVAISGGVINGNVSSSDNKVTIDSAATVNGDVTAKGEVTISNDSTVNGTCSKNGGSTTSTTSPGSFNNRCTNVALRAEWRMDESTWNGTASEVKDSVGGYHGTAAYASGSGPRPTTATGTLAYTNGSQSTCRYGDFDNPNISPKREYTYVQLGGFPDLPAQFTFAAWIRTVDRTVSGQRILVNDDDQNGWALSLGDSGAGSLRIFNRNLRRSGNVSNTGNNSACGTNSGDPFCLDTAAVVNNNTWYFVAATVDTANKRIALYVFDQSGSTLANPSSAYTNNWANGSGTIAIGGETKDSDEGTQSSFHFKGNIDELKVYGSALSETLLKTELKQARTCVAPIDHIRILHDGEGLTCSPETVTVRACANPDCSSLYLGSVGVTLTPGGDSFTFSGGQMTTATVRQPTIGTATLGVSAVSPGVSGAARCFKTTQAGTVETCSMDFVDSGFVFDIPDHSAEVSQSVKLKAVKKADNSTLCTPAFVGQSKTLNFKCTYANPTSGSLPVRISGSALNTGNSATTACDTSGRNISLSFNAAGEATLDVLYADVGQMTVTANYTGASGGAEAGLVMNGSDNFIAAPSDFAFVPTVSPIKAGSAFSATVTARNALGATTKNFGKETVPETVELKSVTAATASANNSRLVGPTGGVSGTVTNGTKGVFAACSPAVDGTICAAKLAWTEVGDVTLSVARAAAGYLGSTLKPFGTANARFIPAFFETEFEGLTPTTQACGTFTYSGQPFRLRVTARSQANTELGSSIATTQNYTGAYAKAVTLGGDAAADCASSTTNFSNNTLASTDFLNGVGKTALETNTTAPLPIIYTQPLGQPSSINVCAKETSADSVSSHGQAQAVLLIRSGRLRLSNAFGSEKQALAMPVQTEYWAKNSWAPNSLDNCTKLLADNFYKSNALTNASDVTLVNGQANLMLSAPGAGNTGSVDIAANLGASGTQQSCLGSSSTGVGGTAGKLPWLRSRNGSCAATYDRDPSARATFGIYSPESRRVVHAREVF